LGEAHRQPSESRFLLRPRARYLFAWLTAVVAGTIALGYAWTCWDDPGREDGNWGHVGIDFGGQWLMGRMLVTGNGRHLYDRTYQRRVLEAAYPRSRSDPADPQSDAEKLLGWILGEDDPEVPRTVASCLTPLAGGNALEAACLVRAAESSWTEESFAHVLTPALGGPLYPPIHAVLFVPLGALPPQVAYRIVQILNLALVFGCGFLIERLTKGNVWWPVASTLLMVFPGYAGAINLGQNPMVSLTLLLLGWRQLTRGRPVVAGLLWGGLAFKPVWAAAFFLVPLLTRRWRMAAAMLATGTVLALLTLPLVGWRSWLDWLAIGRLASVHYAEAEAWIILSRDLQGLPRRWLFDFAGGFVTEPSWQLPTWLGFGLWFVTVATTAALAWHQRRRTAALDGPAATFVLLGAYLSCYHFMYYDALLASLPVFLLFTQPRRSLEDLFGGSSAPDGTRSTWARSPLPPVLLLLLIVLPYAGANLDPTFHFPPFDTLCLLVLWWWCGWTWLRMKDERELLAA
jgi:hypothetical protein